MVQVYDVSGFVQQHPGGRVIMTYAGRDATDVFSSFHAASSWALLKHMCIGELEVSHQAPMHDTPRPLTPAPSRPRYSIRPAAFTLLRRVNPDDDSLAFALDSQLQHRHHQLLPGACSRMRQPCQR